MFLDYFVEESWESLIRIRRASVSSNFGFYVVNSRQNCLLESPAALVVCIFVFVPEIPRQMFLEKGVWVAWEDWKAVKIVCPFKFGATWDDLVLFLFFLLSVYLLFYHLCLFFWSLRFRFSFLFNNFCFLFWLRLLRGSGLMRLGWLGFKAVSSFWGTDFPWRLLYWDVCACCLELLEVLFVVCGFNAVNNSLRNRVKVRPQTRHKFWENKLKS